MGVGLYVLAYTTLSKGWYIIGPMSEMLTPRCTNAFPKCCRVLIYTDLFDVLKNVFTIFIANFKHILAHLSACPATQFIESL